MRTPKAVPVIRRRTPQGVEILESIWHFRDMFVEQELPDDWIYFTQDGGGHLFTFAWYPLHGEPPSDCHPVFEKALRFISKRIAMATDGWPAVGASLLQR